MARKYIPYDGAVVTRADAVKLGLKRYFNGKQCLHGHVSQRIVSSKGCVTCSAIRFSAWEGEHKKERNARKCELRAGNPKPQKKANSTYYQSNRSELLEYARIYRAANPEKRRVWNNTRRAKKSGSSGSYTHEDVLEVLDRQKFKCADCKAGIRKLRHIDHIMPLALGGTNCRRNIQALCPSCNMSKHSKHPIDWAQENGRLL